VNQHQQGLAHQSSVIGFRNVCVICLLAVLCIGQTGPTAAPSRAPTTAPQTAEILPSYEGQNVSSVELAGQPDLDSSQLESLIQQKAGQPFERAKVDATIAALSKNGKFQTVELEIRPEWKGVRVLFVLQPALYFGIYEIPGATKVYSYSRLLQATDYPPRGAYSTTDVSTAQRKLQRFFQRDGYFEAKVATKVDVDHQRGIVNVIFETDLGKRAKFGKVTIAGATPDPTADLQKLLRSRKARLWQSALIAGKPYSLKRLQSATEYLNTALVKRHFLGAQVKLMGAEYDIATKRADITFDVKTGPVVSAKVEGLHLWKFTERKILPIYQQAGVNPEIIQEGRQNLISYLQKKGYFEATVTSDVQQHAEGDQIVYQVSKGARSKVIDVAVAGNHHFSNDELLSHVAVKPRHRFLSRGQYSDKLARASAKNLTNVYAAEGFSAAMVTPEVRHNGDGLAVTFRISEGPQDIVESLQLEGNATQSLEQIAPHGLKLDKGKAYSQKLVDQDRGEIVAHYLTSGYLNASFRAKAQQVGNDPHKLAVVYQITEGPQVIIARVDTLGRDVTRQSLIDRSVNFKPETPLRQDQMLIDENELYNLGIFDWAEIDPRRTITTQTEEDVLVKVHEAKRNSITYGYGFEVINRGGSVPGGTVAVPGIPPVGVSQNFVTSEKTFYGPRGTFQYTRKNLWGKAETLNVSGLAGRLDQRGTVTFQSPHFYGTNWTSQVSVEGEHNSENPIFTSRLAQTGFQLQRPLGKAKHTNLFLRYTLSEMGITRLLIPDLIPTEDLHVRLSTLSGSFIHDTRDNILDAHKGFYESYELDFNPSALGSSVDFTKLLTQDAYYKKIPGNVIWANSVRIGIEEPFNGSHVPLSQEFFSGGGGTLRGFPLNGAGPQRTLQACGTPGVESTCSLITVPEGGRQLLIINSEFRIPVPVYKNLGVVAFYDGGNVFEHVGFHGQYTNTVGAGLRYNTPVGPIRIDLGHNLNAQPGIKSTQLFITLGQAF
jgi:outer membrane protein insertion porin family